MPKEKKEKKDKEQDKKDKKSKSTVSKSLSPLLSPGISLMNADEGRGNKVTDGASGGCEDGVLGKILSQVQKLDLIKKKLDRLETIEHEVTRIKTDLQEYKESVTYTQGQLADACEEVESLKLKMHQNDEQVNKLESMVVGLEGRNKDLESKIVRQEAYSRRENVIIDGIRESHNENCAEKVQQLFRDMGVGECELQRCHRIGIRSAHQTRPWTIITRFVKFGDKMKVMKNGNKLSGKNIYVNDDYPNSGLPKGPHFVPFSSLRRRPISQPRLYRTNFDTRIQCIPPTQ